MVVFACCYRPLWSQYSLLSCLSLEVTTIRTLPDSPQGFAPSCPAQLQTTLVSWPSPPLGKNLPAGDTAGIAGKDSSCWHRMRLSAVLIDLSGTLHVGSSEVPGAVQALQRLRQSQLKVRFVTNTTKDTTRNLVSLVQSIGFDIREHEVFSSLRAAKKVVQDQQLRPLLMLHPDALPEFADVDCSSPNAVVLGLAQQAFTYDSMNTAFRLLLQQPEAPLIAIHKGKYYKASDGQLALGPGPYAAALEYATGRAAQVVGKPQPSFFRLALDDLGVPPEAAAMVGDDVCDDVGGAMKCGMAGILVRTGKYLPGDETAKGVQPTATVKDFAAAVDWILE